MIGVMLNLQNYSKTLSVFMILNISFSAFKMILQISSWRFYIYINLSSDVFLPVSVLWFYGQRKCLFSCQILYLLVGSSWSIEMVFDFCMWIFVQNSVWLFFKSVLLVCGGSQYVCVHARAHVWMCIGWVFKFSVKQWWSYMISNGPSLPTVLSIY